MQGVIAETAPATLATSRGKAPDAAWTAPLGAWRLFALLSLTGGVYSLFYIYKVARDLRDHADLSITPWLYPLSGLVGLANAIAGARLAGFAQSLATHETLKPSSAGGLVGVLIFAAHIVITLSGTAIPAWWYVVGVVLWAVPFVLIERQLSAIKLALPNARYRGKVHAYTKLQWTALALGVVLWALISYGLLPEVARWRGQELAAGALYHDPLGRFSITAPTNGWVVVAPGTVVEDATLELLGPTSSDWAVVHVTEQAGWDLDSLVENRYAEVSATDEDVQFSEKRELAPDTYTALSFSTYSGVDTLDGRFVFYSAAFVTDERAVELIVYSSGTGRRSSGAEQLARSLAPRTPKEADVGQ